MLGNFIWFVFLGGLVSALAWFLAGGVFMITVVGVPFGSAAFRIARFAAFPFGKELMDARLLGEKRIPGTMLFNILWFFLAGLWLAIGHVFSAIACIVSCITVLPIFLGAPAWAVAHLKLASVSLSPLGKRVVSTELAAEARKQQVQTKLAAVNAG